MNARALTSPSLCLRNDLRAQFSWGDDFKGYTGHFIQRNPRYAIKTGSQWITRNKSLSDIPIKAHLEGKYYVASLGRWYPSFTILDIDERSREVVETIRESLGLDENNSMLYQSESKDSYHIIFSIQYNGKPPTLRLLQTILRNFKNSNQIEIYPQANKAIRLPFGSKQAMLDFQYAHLETWEAKLYWYEKLNPFELSGVKGHDMFFDFIFDVPKIGVLNIFEEGKVLLETGLQISSSREQSQFSVLLFLFRSNIPQSEAEGITWNWINKKHNNFSKDILTKPQYVKNHIHAQAQVIYQKYETQNIYPDSTHNNFNGWISEPDIRDIIKITSASLPKMRFLYSLIKYCNPRRHRNSINIHRDKLVEWSSERAYQKRLDELEEKGIIKRGRSYQVGVRSKGISVKWNYRDSEQAVLFDGRSVDSFGKTLKLLYSQDEFRQLVGEASKNRQVQYDLTKSIWLARE